MFSRNKANNFFFLIYCLETVYVTGQNDRQTQILSGQIVILAGHSPVTGHYIYYEPSVWLSHVVMLRRVHLFNYIKGNINAWSLEKLLLTRVQPFLEKFSK